MVVELQTRFIAFTEPTAEYLLELPTVTGVDDGVQAAVEVAQPKDDLEKCFGGPQVGVEGA